MKKKKKKNNKMRRKKKMMMMTKKMKSRFMWTVRVGKRRAGIYSL